MNALDDVSFEVKEGEFFGVIGANGSGKSTLLKILADIYRPTRGTVRVAGRVSPFIELGVGFHTGLTARDNIRINATLLGLGPRHIRRKLDGILAFAELEEVVDHKLKNYSTGMLVRLAYSIAIQVPFDVLLLDEVLAVGDESFQQKCFETFRTFRAEGRTSRMTWTPSRGSATGRSGSITAWSSPRARRRTSCAVTSTSYPSRESVPGNRPTTLRSLCSRPFAA
jgi:ABC-type polysaccharide/polyol phosphate transport system ATPase subunit